MKNKHVSRYRHHSGYHQLASHVATAVRYISSSGGSNKRKRSSTMKEHFKSSKRIVDKERQALPMSFTQTNTQTRMKTDFTNARNGVENSMIRVHTHNKKPHGLAKANMLYHDSFQNTCSWGGNQEAYQVLANVGTTSQWMTGTTVATTPQRAAVSYASWFALNPMSGVAAGSIVNAEPVPPLDKMAALSGVLHVDLFNRTPAPCHVQIEFYVATKDTSATPLAFYDAAITANNVYTTNSSFNTVYPALPANVGNARDIIAPAFGGTPEVLLTPVYSNLTSKRLVRSEWKKVKVWADTLGGGSTHTVTCMLGLNMTGLRERLNLLNLQNFIYPKGSLIAILKCRGTPLVETIPVTLNEVMSMSAGAVGYVINRKVRLNTMKVTANRFEAEFDGFAAPFGAPIGSYHIQDVAPLVAQTVAEN